MKRVFGLSLIVGLVALGIASKAEAVTALQVRICQGAICQDFPGPLPTNTSPGPGPFTNNNILVGDFAISGSVSTLENAALSNAATVTISIQRLTAVNPSADLLIWLNASNFNLPVGPKVFTETLSGTGSAGVAGATESFQGWFSNTNVTGFPPLGSTALATTNCGSVAGTVSCNAPTLSIGVNAGQPFSMVSLTTVHVPTASATATYTTNAQVNVTAVPEPASMLLLGTGLLGVARFGRRRFKATR